MADLVERQLKESKTIAVVGLSPNPDRDSNRVALYLQKVGYRVIPVNPMVEEVLGEKSYPDLKSIPADIEIDMVDVFRRSELVEPVVDEAIELGVKFIWMQDGVIHDESAKKAEAAGIPVIMDN
jgi:hypothetical protein